MIKLLIIKLIDYFLALFRRFFFISAHASNKRRREFVARFLHSLPQNSRLLDIGAGTQKYRPHCSHLIYTSQDLGQYDGKGDGVGHQSGSWDTANTDIISDICSIPVPDASFDAVICTDVLEHVPDVNSALLELDRIVRPGGQILITVPSQCDAHQTPFFFSGGYASYLFKHVFPEYNVTVDYESGFFETIDQKIAHGFNILIRLARKKLIYFNILAGYIFFAFPLVLFIRTLPKFAAEIGINGLLVIIEK